MIKYITVTIEDSHGVELSSTWAPPKNRTRIGNMETDPVEWFKKLVNQRMEQTPWNSDAARERIEIG